MSQWKFVPTQLTEEMHIAAVREVQGCHGNADFPPRVYAAMLAAAPFHEQQPIAWVYDKATRSGGYEGRISLERPSPVGNVHINPLYADPVAGYGPEIRRNYQALQQKNDELKERIGDLITALSALLDEAQPQGIDRPAYQNALALMNRLENAA